MKRAKNNPKDVARWYANRIAKGEKHINMFAPNEQIARQIYAYRAELVRKYKEAQGLAK